MRRNLNVALRGSQAAVPRNLLNHTGMHTTLSQFGEHGTTPAMAARPIHTNLLIQLTKHLLDCLTAESTAFLAREQRCISRCFGSVLPYVLSDLLPQLLTYHSLLTLCAFGLPAFQQNRVFCLSIAAYRKRRTTGVLPTRS